MADRGRIPAALAIAAVCAFAQVPAAAASSCPGAETEAEGQSTAELEQSVLCLINQRRDAAGVGRLKTSAQLAEAAAKHSSDMVEKGYFDHTSPTGSTFVDRISATGYMRSARSWLVGENLVWGSGELSTPGSLVESWMESPPHRANLLRGRFREIGLAGARGTPERRPERHHGHLGVRLSGLEEEEADPQIGAQDRPPGPGAQALLEQALLDPGASRSGDVEVDGPREPLQLDLADRLEAKVL